MAIELSSLTFTNKADTVPQSGTDQILNNGTANTLDGNDLITATSPDGTYNALINHGTIDTGDGNDTITGTADNYAISNEGVIKMGNGKDAIIADFGNLSSIDTGSGDDTINGIQGSIFNGYNNTIEMGDGNDKITSNGIISNTGIIKTGSGNDQIISTDHPQSGIFNYLDSIVDTGDGNDTIIGFGEWYGVRNKGTIKTGAGNDVITGSGPGIFNYFNSIVDTGDGNDTITGTNLNGYIWGGITNCGIIKTGNGKDCVIANGDFSGMDSGLGTIFLDDGQDYLKGFGDNYFYGGNGKDTLELTSGTYTIGISGTTVSFTKGNATMYTSEFEKLIAGQQTYDFSSLTSTQTIIIA